MRWQRRSAPCSLSGSKRSRRSDSSRRAHVAASCHPLPPVAPPSPSRRLGPGLIKQADNLCATLVSLAESEVAERRRLAAHVAEPFPNEDGRVLRVLQRLSASPSMGRSSARRPRSSRSTRDLPLDVFLRRPVLRSTGQGGRSVTAARDHVGHRGAELLAGPQPEMQHVGRARVLNRGLSALFDPLPAPVLVLPDRLKPARMLLDALKNARAQLEAEHGVFRHRLAQLVKGLQRLADRHLLEHRGGAVDAASAGRMLAISRMTSCGSDHPPQDFVGLPRSRATVGTAPRARPRPRRPRRA